MTYELQINGKCALILEGELRPESHKLGGGGLLKVIATTPPVATVVLKGDQVRLVELPDAPKTSQINRQALVKKGDR